MYLNKIQNNCLILIFIMSWAFWTEIHSFKTANYLEHYSIDVDQVFLKFLDAFQKKIERNTFTKDDGRVLYHILKIQIQRRQKKRLKNTVYWYSRQGR